MTAKKKTNTQQDARVQVPQEDAAQKSMNTADATGRNTQSAGTEMNSPNDANRDQFGPDKVIDSDSE